METSGQVKLLSHELEQLHPKSPHEANVPITHYGQRQTPILKHMFEEQMGSLLNGAFFGCENESGILRVSIHYY